jgi:hypothetical protein
MSSVDTADTVDASIVVNEVHDFPDVSQADTAIDIPVEYFLDSVDSGINVRAVLKEELLPIKDQLAALAEKLEALMAK